MALVTWDEFCAAVRPYGGPPQRHQYDYFIRGLESRGGVTSKTEAAMLLAQVVHESGGLRHKEEIAFAGSTGPNCYSTAEDHPGKSYHGRGYIQLTWVYNYKAASRDIFGNEHTLWANPEKVLEEKVAWETTFWFWRVNVHSQSGVAQGRFGATTKAINGALEPPGSYLANVRFEKYGHVRRALGLSGPGTM